MSKPTVFVTRQLPNDVEARLKQDYDARLNTSDKIYSNEEIIKYAEGAVAIIPCHTEKMTAELIQKLPASVKALCCFSVGYDHIDLEAAKAKGIQVTNTPNVLNDATAEIAMLLLLGAARREYEGETQIRTDSWADWGATFQLGKQVSGAKLGILGMGRVGQIMAKRARGFDMEIHYYNRSRLPSDLEMGATYHSNIESLFPHSDFLSIHCPATPDTHHIINKKTIALLPDNAVLVNTARGAVVNDDDLISALKSGKLFSAGLDVFNDEPNIDSRYKELDNTFLLPHIGSATLKTRNDMGFRALDNLDAIIANKIPKDKLI